MARSLNELSQALYQYAFWVQEAQAADPEDAYKHISIQDVDGEMLEEAAEIVAMYEGLTH